MSRSEHEVATVAELVAEVERLRSDLTLSLMGSELEKLGAERDELGQRLSKLEVEAERDQLKAAVERVREALDRVVLDHRYTGEPTSTGYQGAADYIRAALDGDYGKGAV